MHGRIDKVIEGGGRETGRRHLLDPRLLVAYCIASEDITPAWACDLLPAVLLLWLAPIKMSAPGVWCCVRVGPFVQSSSHTPTVPAAYHPPPPATPLPLLWSALSRSLVIFLTLHPVRTLAAAGPWLDINYQIRARNEPSRSFHNHREVPY